MRTGRAATRGFGRGCQAEATGRALAAAQILHQANIACLLGSVAAADWPQQLEQAAGLLSDKGKALLDGVCLTRTVRAPRDFLITSDLVSWTTP